MKVRQHNDIKGPVEDCELPVCLVCVQLIVALGKGRWEKLASREELAEAFHSVEVDVVLARRVDVLAPVIVEDAE